MMQKFDSFLNKETQIKQPFNQSDCSKIRLFKCLHMYSIQYKIRSITRQKFFLLYIIEFSLYIQTRKVNIELLLKIETIYIQNRFSKHTFKVLAIRKQQAQHTHIIDELGFDRTIKIKREIERVRVFILQKFNLNSKAKVLFIDLVLIIKSKQRQELLPFIHIKTICS